MEKHPEFNSNVEALEHFRKKLVKDYEGIRRAEKQYNETKKYIKMFEQRTSETNKEGGEV